MTNELTIEKARDLMQTAYDLSTSGKIWEVEPLGHSEFQLRKFVLNDKQFPTPDLKFRQAVLEVWDRWAAWRYDKYTHDKLGAQIEIWRAEQEELREQTGKTDAQHKKIDAQVKMLDIEIANATEQRKELELDMQYRIIRETSILVDELRNNAPAEGERMKVELANWLAKAGRDPKVKELMEGK